MLDGVGALRNVVINPLTDETDLEALMALPASALTGKPGDPCVVPDQVALVAASASASSSGSSPGLARNSNPSCRNTPTLCRRRFLAQPVRHLILHIIDQLVRARALLRGVGLRAADGFIRGSDLAMFLAKRDERRFHLRHRRIRHRLKPGRHRRRFPGLDPGSC